MVLAAIFKTCTDQKKIEIKYKELCGKTKRVMLSATTAILNNKPKSDHIRYDSDVDTTCSDLSVKSLTESSDDFSGKDGLAFSTSTENDENGDKKLLSLIMYASALAAQTKVFHSYVYQ